MWLNFFNHPQLGIGFGWISFSQRVPWIPVYLRHTILSQLELWAMHNFNSEEALTCAVHQKQRSALLRIFRRHKRCNHMRLWRREQLVQLCEVELKVRIRASTQGRVN